MSEIISFKRYEPRCSFCSKKESEVKRLVQSADKTHYICDQCIKQATERLKDES